MECQTSNSKSLFKVFDASKRRRARKKRDGVDESSLVTDESNSGYHPTLCRTSSAKASLQNVSGSTKHGSLDNGNRDSSPAESRSPSQGCRGARSPRRYRRSPRDGISLALKAGMASTPRSISPPQNTDGTMDVLPQDQDSIIYTFLEEAVKREKKKHRHYRRHEDGRESPCREHRHHRHRHDKSQRDVDSAKLDANVVFETFAKLCTKLTEKTVESVKEVQRIQSHKSLQCETVSKRDFYDVNQKPVKLRSNCNSRDDMTTPKVRSEEHVAKTYHDHIDYGPDHFDRSKIDKYDYHEKDDRYKRETARSRGDDSARYREYNVDLAVKASRMVARDRDYRDEDRREYDRRPDKKGYIRNCGEYDERDDRTLCRRSFRSDQNRDKSDRRCEARYSRQNIQEDKYYDDRPRISSRSHHYVSLHKEQPSRRHLDSRFDRNSVVSRDDDYKERERYSERERDSGLSVADGDTSVVSNRSTYLKAVKQEIAEQREAMDKMMQLWKELMRCFKGMSQSEKQCDKNIQESATNAKNSAAEQLRLWRECMRRYETVARDVGDTDARLMEEINKQRSEMAEMAGMWHECLQKYRDMSNDFNSLKQQLAISESPSRIAPAVTAPLVCAEAEGIPQSQSYRIPPGYATPSLGGNGPMPALRSRASVPPAWWWGAAEPPPRSPARSPRRRSSPDSRGSRDRDKRTRHKERERDREDSRYRSSKPSKPTVTKASDHSRHKKR